MRTGCRFLKSNDDNDLFFPVGGSLFVYIMQYRMNMLDYNLL